MRLSLLCPADVAPLAVPNNDTTPLHTPTLLPMSPHPVPAPPTAGAAPAPPSETERPPHCSESHAAPHQCFPNQAPKTRDIHQFSTSFAAAVPHDWFINPDSLKESFRIASNLDWANIDLSGYPGKLCESQRAKVESFLGFGSGFSSRLCQNSVCLPACMCVCVCDGPSRLRGV